VIVHKIYRICKGSSSAHCIFLKLESAHKFRHSKGSNILLQKNFYFSYYLVLNNLISIAVLVLNRAAE